MARRAASSSVRVNFKDVENRRTPPEGDYPLRVAEAKKEKSANKNDQISFIFEISKGEFKGSKLYLHCPLLDNSLWKLASVLEALGVEVPQDELDVDLDDLIDRDMMGVVHHEKYNGRNQARLGDWAPISELKDFDEGDTKKDKKKKKDKKSDKGADEKKSKKDKKSGGDDADKNKKKSKEKKKKGNDDADAGSGKKDKKSKKDKGGIKYDSDKVADMEEKELKKIIKAEGLDVDLGDYKSQRKKAGAVIDALEEAKKLAD